MKSALERDIRCLGYWHDPAALLENSQIGDYLNHKHNEREYRY